MSLLKTIARSIVFPVIHSLRIDYLFGRMSPNRRMILCFHGVTAQPHFALNNRHMPVEQFDRLIRYLSKRYAIVSVAEIFEQPATGKKKQLCLTFDDGYLDNYTTALPILEKYGVPATFYIITEGLSHPGFMVWTDLLDFILLHLQDNELTMGGYRFLRTEGVFRCEALNGQSITDYLKTTGPEKYAFLEQLSGGIPQLEAAKNAFPDYWKLLTAEELKAFAASPWVTIGSHTVRHHNLSEVPEELAATELAQSKASLEAVLGQPVDSIAYPDGSYTAEVKDIAEKAGYAYQLAVSYKLAGDQTDQRILSRLSISNSTVYQSIAFQINTGFDKIGF